MNNWSMLGLEPTEDREAIKRAYMAGLTKHNPEDDPDGFSRFRLAYENILKELDQKDKENENDQTPLGLFMNKLTDVYNDIDRRRDEAVWEALLKDEACMRLDLVEATEQSVLTFLMDNNILAKRVWNVLNNRFDWASRADDLKQQFVPNFIDFVVRSLTWEDLTEELFELDADAKAHHYDKWVQLYYEISSMVNMYQTENPNFAEKQKELEALPVRHIYYNLQLARMYIGLSKPEESLAITEVIYGNNPEDTFARYTHAMGLLHTGKHEEALAHYNDMLAKNPAYVDAKKGIVDVRMAMKDYTGAREVLLDILNEYPYDTYAYSAFQSVTEEMVKILEEKHAANPKDLDTLFDLAKNYLNANQLEECRRILNRAPKDDTRYYEYMSEVYSRNGEFDKALPLHETLLSREQKQIHYNGYVRTLIALNRLEDALEQIEKGLALQEADSIWAVALCERKGYALYVQGRFEDALAALDQGIKLNDRSANLYQHKAKVYMDMGYFSEAIDCCETARMIIPYMTDAYTLQMEIYNNAGMFEQMLYVSDLADQVNFDSPRVKYHKAGALRMLGDNAAAKEIIDALLVAEFDEGYRDLFYVEASHLAEAEGRLDEAIAYIKKAIDLQKTNPHHYVVLGNLHSLRREYREAMKIFDQLIKENKDHVLALIGRGDTFEAQGNFTAARKDYEAILAAYPEYDLAFARMIGSYMNEGLHDKAIEWANKRIEMSGSLDNYLDLAFVYRNAGRNEKAEETFKDIIKRFPDDMEGYRSYGYFLGNQKRADEAIEQLKLAIEKDPNYGDVYEELGFHLENKACYEEALAIVAQGWALELGNHGALAMRKGFILKAMGRYQEAAESMQEAAALPEQLDGWGLADIYDRIASIYELDLNDAAAALKYYTLSLEQDKNYASALRGMGDLYLYFFKDYTKALEYYARKIAVEPNEPGAYVVKARACAKAGKKIAAWLSYKKAIKLYEKEEREEIEEKGTLCPEVYLANCYLGLGKHELARKGFQAMLGAPERKKSWCAKSACDVCLHGLGQLAEQAGDLDSALDYYEQAIAVSNSVRHNEAKKAILERK